MPVTKRKCKKDTSCGKPTAILERNTERMEAEKAGSSRETDLLFIDKRLNDQDLDLLGVKTSSESQQSDMPQMEDDISILGKSSNHCGTKRQHKNSPGEAP